MPKKLPDFQDKRLNLITGTVDMRSPSGTLGSGNYRLALNMAVNEQGRFGRMGGWKKLLSDSPFGFKNQDLHDQLVDCQFYYESYSQDVDEATWQSGSTYQYWDQLGFGYGPFLPVYDHQDGYTYRYCGGTLRNQGGCREPLTMVMEATSSRGRRTLVAATTSRIYAMSDTAGNWRILADRLGGGYSEENNCQCGPWRFKAAQAGDFVMFTNGIDPVLSWNIGAGPSGCDIWSADYVLDLLALNITSAKTVSHWRGFVFIGDVVADGVREASRIVWSDFNDPNSWYPGGESSAGFVDIGQGERVLAIEPLGGQLRVYTTRGSEKAIYEVALVGGDEVFNFREIYRGPDGLDYPNSIVNTGRAHIYVGESDIYYLGEYDRIPQRIDWIHKASGAIFNGIPAEWVDTFQGMSAVPSVNKSACEQVVGGYDSGRKVAWFSWPTGESVCCNTSLMLFLDYGKASLVNDGFAAFCNHRPDYSITLRDWLVDSGVCAHDDLLVSKEGESYLSGYTSDPPAYLWNETNDPDLPAHADSMCTRVAGQELKDFCRACEADSTFVMAGAADWILKEYDHDLFQRESFNYFVGGDYSGCQRTTPGVYTIAGYYSMLQGEADDLGIRTEKLINRASLSFEARDQTEPSNVYFQVGYGQHANCMVWVNAGQAELSCQTSSTDAQHKTNMTRPGSFARFPLYRRGIYLSWRFYIGGPGGGAVFDDLVLSVKNMQTEW